MIILNILIRSLALIFTYMIFTFKGPFNSSKVRIVSRSISIVIFVFALVVSYIDTMQLEIKMVILIVNAIGYFLIYKYQVRNSVFNLGG